MGKKATLLELISMQKPYIIICTETPEVSNNKIIPSDFNYNIYRNEIFIEMTKQMVTAV